MEYKSASAATLEVGTKPRNLRVVAMGTCIKSQLAPVALLLAILLCATAPSRPSHSEMDTANEWRDDGQQGDLDKARQASAKLRSHLRSVRVAREQIAPLVAFNDTEPMVPLHTAITLMSVLDVNEVRQTVQTGLYLQLEWRDEALAWNKSHHGGVGRVQVDPGSIWIPQLVVANSMDMKNMVKEAKVLRVQSDGHVKADIPCWLETSCSMDLTRYPFDEQTCTIKIVSYSALKWEIYEQNYDESLAASLAFSTEWHLTEVSTRFFSLKGEMHPEVVLLLRRKTTFYTVCLVLPMVLTSYMNALVFLVSLQSGEKVSFLVTIFVSNSVYIGFFSSMMPRGLDSVPNSMVLLVGVMVESLLVLLATLFVLRRFHGEQAPTGGCQTPDGIIVQWSGDSGGLTEMATECMESARLSGVHKTDGTDPSLLSWGRKSDPNHCTMTFEKQPRVTKFPKSTIHDNKSYVQPSSPLACKITRASKSSKAVSRLTFSMRAHQLDWVLFTVAFVANTIFLLVLYAFAFG